MYGWGCGRSLSSKKMNISTAGTLRKISVNHQVGAHLCHLGVEKKKKKSWTELTSQKLLEGSTGKLLWALPGAVRDDADGAPSLQWGGDFWAPCGTSKNWGLAGGMEANFQCCVHGLF